MRDAIELEWAGIPSVALIAQDLTGAADAMKRLSGMPDYEYVTVDYAKGSSWSDQEVREFAKQTVSGVLALLMEKER